MTKVIAVACAKGGCSKTTTSMNLAGILHRWGYPTVVLDADNTGGATKWAMYVLQAGKQLGFSVTPVNKVTLDRRLIEQQYPDSWVFIDTPPSDTGIIDQAIGCADVTIIPTQPSTLDLTLAGETYRGTPNGIILLTRVKKNTILTKNALEDLDSDNVFRFQTTISERESIKQQPGTVDLDMQEYSSVAQELVDFIKSTDKEA